MIVLFVEGLASGTAMPRTSATAEKETRAGKNSCQDEPDQSEAGQSSVMRHYYLPFLQRVCKNRRAIDQSDHTCKRSKDMSRDYQPLFAGYDRYRETGIQLKETGSSRPGYELTKSSFTIYQAAL